ncbi:hypothetical protein AAC387_Pa08g1384 [Persea americana]
MGIQGLLPLLKSIMVPMNIEELRGCSAAVDTYSWLHKGALSCSKDLCKGLPTTRHIDYCMHRVNLLRHHGVKPILVFDGGLLPMKCDQENRRWRARKENLERALEHESAGNSAAAYECYQKAVDITPSIALELILVLKKENVDYVVAPYEADAQMAFLSINKYVDAVITEDSDLIPFGCSRIVFKMDKFGQGVEFQYSMLQQNKELNFTGFTKKMLLEMCILSGCDYLQSLPGMGLKKAHALVRKFKSYDKVIKHLRYSAVSVPPTYDESFKKAMWSFQHQRVYDPTIEDIVHLTDIPHDLGSDLDFLGPLLPQSVVKGIAKGELDPFTKLPFQGEMIHTGVALDKTYSVKQLKLEKGRRKRDLTAKENVLTNYFSSLEAKRQFKAPRKSPEHLRSLEKYSHHDGDVSNCRLVGETVECDLSCRKGSPLESRNDQDGPPVKDSMEDSFAADADQALELPNCEKLCGSDHHMLLQQSKHDMSKPSPALDEDHKCESPLVSVEGKPLNRNLVVRSRYFRHKLSDENDHVNKEEKSTLKKDTSGTVCDLTALENASLRSKFCKNSIRRGKSISPQSIQNENAKAQDTLTNAPKGNHAPDPISKCMEAETEQGNFVCNISHLSRYSTIAEKSMEKFVSVMSSFKYVQSGSRASGLRAPMKDASNTCTLRSTVEPLDFSKFSYVPNNRGIASASKS